MSAVRRQPLPAHSRLHAFVKAGDFLDCYAAETDRPVREAAEILTDFPAWTNLLLTLRNAIVRPFGLATEPEAGVDTVGIFPVESESEDELIAGFDDRHLNFRISVLTDRGSAYLSTWVHPHNLGGRVYLAAVMPFHVLIIRNALSRLSST